MSCSDGGMEGVALLHAILEDLFDHDEPLYPWNIQSDHNDGS